MVLVEPPAGWQPTAEPDSSGSGESLPLGVDSTDSRRRWEKEVQPGEKVTPSAATPGSGGFHFGESSGGVSSSDISSPSGNLADSSVRSPLTRKPDSASLSKVAATVPPEKAAAASAPAAGLLAVPWLKWALIGGVPTVIIIVATGIWLSRPPSETVEVPPLAVAPSPAAPIEKQEPTPSPPVKEEPEEKPQHLSQRWLPTQAQAVVSLRPKSLLEQPASRVLLDRTGAFWQAAVDKLVSGLGIDPQSLARTTWSSTDVANVTLDDWLTEAVVVVELDHPLAADARALRDSESLNWNLDSAPVRELKSRAWPHPFAILDKLTIITGPEKTLRELASREEHRLASEALHQLIEVIDARSAAVAIVDLQALRKTDALPQWVPLVDTLHADADDWQLLRTLPLALGAAVGIDGRVAVELDLACDGASSAEQVQAALDRVLKAVEKTFGSEADGLTTKLLAGQINTALAGELKNFLTSSGTALADRVLGARDSLTWARVNWQGDLPKLATGFLASVPELEASRLVTARHLDEEHHRLLLEGLTGYVTAEGALPAGAAGATLLPPETRLSWQATLLPYYGHLDWHNELNFARSWNDTANQRVTRRPLEVMVNPALGPGTTKAGFPVTHYVGVAGLGEDAGQLDTEDPRAGVFGFRPRFSPTQIPDGASNTIAVAGVAQKLGPWASGGAATVRGFTQRPYINGPDGFSSGQPDGMLVGMADGSVRFMPKDIDPAVFERLVTINGGDGTIDKLANKPAPAADPLPVVDAMPEKSRGEPTAEVPDGRNRPARPKAAKPDAEVARHLDDKIPQIELKNTTLGDLVDLLSQYSTIPMTIDAEALAASGIGPDARVSVSLENTTVGEVLDAALRHYELKYILVGNQLIVTDARQTGESLESTSLGVGDLIGSEPDGAKRLAQMVETMVAPTAWQSFGGSGSVEAAGRSLQVNQTQAVTNQVADFLDKLRLARGLPVSRREARRLTLASRWTTARAKLATKVTVNFVEPTPLKQIAGHLQKVVGLEIVFDGLSLASAGVSSDAPASVSCNQEPLADVLPRLLEPLKLAYRVVNEQRIEIASARDVADELELEFYSIKSYLPDGADGADDLDELAAGIRKEVAPSSWREHGGTSALVIDARSRHLIVLAPQPVQTELETWIGQHSKSKTPR